MPNYSSMSSGYWNYYDDNFDWDDAGERHRPDLALSHAKLLETGLSDEAAWRYVASGFIYQRYSDTIIDRYYGGELLSMDGRTRFACRGFSLRDKKPASSVRVHRAQSWRDVRRAVEKFAALSSKRLLFRGQTQSYTVSREVPNPFFLIDGIGEVSLIPSLWRRMVGRRAGSYLTFQNISLLELSSILYTAFDLSDIERRHTSLHEGGAWIFTSSDL